MAIAIFGIISIANAQKKSVNGRAYEKINNKWYQSENGYQYEVDKATVTIKFKPGVSESRKNLIIQSNNCNIIRSNSLGYYDLQITDNSLSLDVVENFLRNSSIEVAEANTFGEFISPANDTYYGDQWHLQDEDLKGGIDAHKAWDKENGNPNVVIAILDSGTDILHQDLEGNIWVNSGEDLDGDGVVWDADDMNGVDDDGNGKIDDLSGWDFGNNNNDLPSSAYHGTHVAGITGAETNDGQGVAGVAGGWTNLDKGCNLLIGAVGSSAPLGSVLDDAILYAAQQGVKVISMSLSVGTSQAIIDAINTAYNTYGCFVNNASGNSNSSSLPFPANVENCFAVGASTEKENPADPVYKASFSNYGEGLMILAPGVDIKSTRLNNTYGTGSGTSYASPQVAATAGLIASYYQNFTMEDIKRAMCITAEKLPAYTFTNGYEYGSWNNEVGYGKLNANRALGIKGTISNSEILYYGNYIADVAEITNTSNILVADEATLYVIKDGELFLKQNSTLEINGKLVVKNNCNINIESGSVLNLNGEIEVKENCSLTISGSGYTRLSGNINCELDATITFEGVNQATKLLEVNKQIQFDTDFANITIKNGKIQMNNTYAELYINSGVDNVTIDNVLVSSNNGINNSHKGIDIRSNGNVKITNSTFEYGTYGIYASRASNSSLLVV
ncbi:MAG: S8 family serine peptidase, partial [Bacteroidales bacterium]|nr:S8 family serine peptidase [Bacteroidales bacterium]